MRKAGVPEMTAAPHAVLAAILDAGAVPPSQFKAYRS
jgi:hypothetical protein